ncbi:MULTISPECIES: hypothetical protein [unclassified Sinorhizobium]|uniref:hypothetical protein n=1 Tax=unclassified Sinorhizobium TaxID=2613772 RepID=UPI0024C2B231|nr:MULTISPECIES: hypothetical protein [unclassified Sinorhizobium]MDK1376509.1 hypothetical protein [Sinorhizobium sp. 6-70]MDK1482107.1 hypothetical protein [Sinorhizobium sp. 6-117]
MTNFVGGANVARKTNPPVGAAISERSSVAPSHGELLWDAARLIAEFALSQEMQTAFAEAGVYPIRAGIASPKGLPEISSTKLIELDLLATLKERDKILNW